MAVQGASLREQLEENYDKIIAPAAESTATSDVPATTITEVKTDAPAAQEVKTEERTRDPATGQFLKTEEKKDAAPQKAAPAAPAARAVPSGVVAAPIPDKLGIKRPDSWKKELWSIWEKFDSGQSLTREERKAYLEYQLEREGQYTKGVSAYKAEADNAKRLNEALAPFQPLMQSQGIAPERFITTLASTHQVLSGGSPQEKLRAFARFAQDYQIPLHELLVQGEDGKVYLNQQYFASPQSEATDSLSPQDIDKRVDARMQQMMLQRLVQEFVAAKDGGGNALHPHFQEVRASMDGLLRSGLAKDLQGAYDAALRLPQHTAIFEAMQQQQRKAEDDAKAKEEADKAARARANAVSPRSSTPTGSVAGSGKKGLRSALEDAYDQHVTGRI